MFTAAREASRPLDPGPVMHRTAVAIVGMGSGATIHTLSAIFGASGDSSSLVLPALNAGGSLSIVGALVYLVKQLVDGKIVAQPVTEQNERNAQQAAQYATLLAENLRLAQQVDAREREYLEIIRELRSRP